MARGLTHRAGIVGKLMAVSVVLLTIPWLTFRYRGEMHDFVLRGQRDALKLAAQAVATVLHGRDDLFAEAGGLPFAPWDEPSCSPLPLEAPVRLDGNGRDWPADATQTCRYQRAQSAWSEEGASLAFDLTLAQRDDFLYALVRVQDDAVRFRHPRHRNLDGSDHLRVTLPGAGDERRYVITAAAPGVVSAYEVGQSWRYAQGDGLPERRILGTWAETDGGYVVELRLPLEMAPSKRIGLAVADVDAASGRLEGVVGAAPGGTSGRIQLVLLESPEIDRILRALELPGAKISVIDDRRRVRSEFGSAPDGPGDPQRGRLLDVAFEAGVGAAESGRATTAAASPIRVGGRVVGAVLIEQANDRILALPRQALERERNAIIAACVAIAAIFWLFAWRLAWRIHRLRDEASDAIDPEGRVRSTALHAGRRAGDEVGDLSRAVSGLLVKLARYTSFLERIPSTLRHELSNPLNTLSTSLQNLVSETPAVADSKYLKSAERGVSRISEIVESLTEAASLEEALRHDDLETVDLARVVVGYVENFAAGCPERRFSVRGGDARLPVRASDFRIEQLLDKLVDNAVAFSDEGSEIAIELGRGAETVSLAIANDGPPIPEDVRERVFESMFSGREARVQGQPHLGLGLYIARLIVDRLGGKVEVENRVAPGGPVFTLTLPFVEGAD